MYLEAMAITEETGHEAGRKLLAQMYAKYIGSPLPEIRTAPRGKPYFLDSPWHFSISHSKRHVFCALSRKRIGIDAEEIDREVNLMLARKILSPMEQTQFAHVQDPRLALLTFWVLKEAQAKMTGEGLRGFPNQTEFMLTDPRVRQMENCLVAVIEEDDHVI